LARRFIASLLLALPLLVGGGTASADEGWEIQRFHADIAIQPDGALAITESIDVDFRNLDKHGIFREIPVRYGHSNTQDRLYELAVTSVRDAAGRAWRYEVEWNGANRRIRIGDPDRTVRGPQTYRLTYTVRGALNAFEQHDELYWNVNGPDWGVPSARVSAAVRAPAAVTRSACFQGFTGSSERCEVVAGGDGNVSYVATRALRAGEQLTIVAALPKGAVAAPVVLYEERARDIDRWFELTPASLGLAALALLGGLGLVARNWWARGRDRRFLKRAAFVEETEEGTAALFDAPTVIAEYEPPDKLSPAQLGLILDERADAKDLTATVVDLAVRGVLRIEKVERSGVFGRDDWRLVRLRDDNGLSKWESELVDGIFEGANDVLLSERKGKVAPALHAAQRELYDDAMERHWFTSRPEYSRLMWGGLGLFVAVGGVALAVFLGLTYGFGLVGVSVAIVGAVLVSMSSAMARRSAAGSELLRRTLGFRRYMETAEKDRAAFAEREGIFSAYLPYAIVFGIVERWAKAFEGLDREATRAMQGMGWYVGHGAFSPTAFSNELSTFSSTVSSTIAYTPGSRGASGFSGSGGFSGGGGGGGGGGSW
jgi:YD repeat-containing protein